jgi:hypothetical protein
MHSVVGHLVILATAASAICVMSYAVGWPRVTPPSEPAVSVQDVPIPRDIASLTREIQRELKRIGCYEGELNGRWNAQSRQAMKAFTDHVNAKLPLDRPDHILLRLAQGHQGSACGTIAPKTVQPASPSLLYEGRVPKAGTQPN